MATSPVARKYGKRYAIALAEVDPEQVYSVDEAIALVKKTAKAKFDETVELHISTGADPRHADQMVRGTVVLPHGTGKLRRVLVFAQGEGVTLAREAGADFIGDDEVIQRIEKEGWVEFDASIATPDLMGRIGRLGRVLGRRGLMPNPRTGTVVETEDIPRAVREAKGGRIEYRLDRTGIIHLPIGKASFESQQLKDNLAEVLHVVNQAKPEKMKGQFFLTVYLTSSMGPGIKLDTSKLQGLRSE